MTDQLKIPSEIKVNANELRAVETTIGPSSFNYASEVATHQLGATKPRLVDLVDENLHHFVGFAEAGAKLGFACERIAAVAGCNPHSLRRVFLLKLGSWAAFRAGLQKDVRPNGIQTETPETTLSANAGETHAARVW